MKVDNPDFSCCQPHQLWLGRVGGESPLLGSFNGQYVYYEIKPDEQDVIIP